MKKKFSIVLMLVCMMSLLFFQVVQAKDQPDDFTIKLNRNFGYSGFAGDIQGTFTIVAKTAVELVRIEYYLDDELMAEVGSDDFRYKFETDSYSLGVHTIRAVGYDADNVTYASNEIRAEFVSASTGWNSMVKIMVPILVLSLVMTFISYAIANQGKSTAKRRGDYGIWGGSICSKCGRPFSRQFWGINLGVGRLERCPYCKSWMLTHRASAGELAAAEARFAEGGESHEASPRRRQEEYRRSIDESRYIDE